MSEIRPQLLDPAGVLRGLVRDYWWVAAADVLRSGIMQADGCVGFSCHVTRSFGRVSGQRLAPDDVVGDARHVKLAPGEIVFGVRFEPGGFFRLFGPACGWPAPAPSSYRTLAHVVESLDRPEVAWERIDELLVRRLRTPDPRRRAIVNAAFRLREEVGPLALQDVAREAQIGVRHFERLFQEHMGMPARTFARVQRVNRARHELKQPTGTLVDVAVRCGFYDQAHLTREFRRCVGVTPLQYRKRHHDGRSAQGSATHEPFFTTKGEQGTGLGLSTVHGIVTHGGGHVNAQSAPGKGTTMTILLPEAQHWPSARPAPAPLSSPPARSTILVAEDDEAVRDVMVSALRESGHEVLSAPDGDAAIELARRYRGSIDLLCSDGVMPGLGTAELITGFRHLFPQAPVLVCSGHVREDDLREKVEARDVHYLGKPFTGGALLDAVAKALQAGPRRRESQDRVQE